MNKNALHSLEFSDVKIRTTYLTDKDLLSLFGGLSFLGLRSANLDIPPENGSKSLLAEENWSPMKIISLLVDLD